MYKRLLALCFIFCFLLFAGFPASADKRWYPLDVEVWAPPFNTERTRSQKQYTPLDKATRPWSICVSIPHLKDAYWLAVNFGLVDEARRLGIKLDIYEAGGYERLQTQRDQIERCLDGNPDGLIVSAISADGLTDLVVRYAEKGIPVIDLINGMSHEGLTARVSVDFWDMGYQIGQYLLKLTQSSDGNVSVGWFPGPAGAEWVDAGDQGFKAAISGSNITIVDTLKGDTGTSTQARLVTTLLDKVEEDVNSDLDYIVGTTTTINSALGILRKRHLDTSVKLLSYYYGPGVHKGIKRGSVIAAPTDSPTTLARISIDTMVRILEKKAYFKHVGAKVIVIDRANQKNWDATTSIAPKGFRPVFNVGN